MFRIFVVALRVENAEIRIAINADEEIEYD